MGNGMSFFIAMNNVPTVTAQMHKVTVVNGRPRFYDEPVLRDARAKLKAHVAKHRPEEPFEGAIRLLVKWCFPVSGNHRDGEYRTSRPDTDNLQKMLKDIMTECGFWKDDALVASEIIEKFWAAKPGLYIAIEPLEDSYADT